MTLTQEEETILKLMAAECKAKMKYANERETQQTLLIQQHPFLKCKPILWAK